MKKLFAKVLGIGMSASMLLTALPAGVVHAAVDKSDTVNMIGNAHIDAAWNWRYRDVESNYLPATVKRALDDMNANSDYHFSFSSSQFYQWLQEYWPDLVPQVKSKVNNGQWEITGGQVIEPDLNNTNGESMVRQSLYAQNYFRDNYGVMAAIGWVPDVFGFNYQMPQILKKSGMDKFVTTKLNWNDTNKWPYEYFDWTSPDGSTVRSYKPTNDYSLNGSDINSSKLAGTLTYPVANGLTESLVLYGAGDNGGGPTSSDISTIRSINSSTASGTPSVKMNRADTVFADLDAQVKANQSANPSYRVPEVNNELYFEYHRGVMTTADPMKKYNRYSEETAETAEKFSSVATLLGTETYPQDKINEAWQKTLLNQFHDVLPGSAYTIVYQDAFNNAEIALNQFNNAKNTALNGIANRINTQGEGKPIILVNALSWDRTDIAQAEITLSSPASAVSILDSTGKEIASQLVRGNGNKATVSFEATVPAMGYALYRAVEKDNASYATTLKVDDANKVIENQFFKVTINPVTGNISSIIDKKNNNKEVVDTTGGQEFNRFQFLSDTPRDFESWNIDYDDMSAAPTEINTASSVTLVENGPAKATYKISKVSPSKASTIDEYITLYNDVNRIDTELKINWNEKQQMLKVALPVSVHPSNVTYDIAYGTIDRPAANTKGMFEVEGYKFADMSKDGYGVSVLSDSKEGWDCPNGVLRLSLLRSATDGRGGNTDPGLRDIKYSIYPHSGDWKTTDTELKSYEYDYPLTSVVTSSHTGDLASAASFGKAAAADNNVIMSVFKKAEVRGIDQKNGEDRSNSYIVRLAETEGKDGSAATVTLPAKITSAKEVNLIEDTIKDAAAPTLNNNQLTTTLNKYEIKTFLVTFDNSAMFEDQKTPSQPVDLSAAYNLDGISYNSNRKDGDYTGKGESIPAELMPDKVTSEDVTYNLGPKAEGQKNIVQALGQTIDISNAGNHKYLFMLGNSTGGVGLGQFKVNYSDGTSTSKIFNFAGWKDIIGFAQQSYVKDTIGLNLSHTHLTTGDTYDVQNNFFVYKMPIDPAKTVTSITMPDASAIKVAAMSFVDGNIVLSEDQQAPAQVQNLSVTGSKQYYNTSVNLTWDAARDNDSIAAYYVYRATQADLSDAVLLTTTTDTKYTDSSFAGVNKYYYAVCAQDPTGNVGPLSAPFGIYAGANIALFKPVTVDGQMNANEAASMINDGDITTKWCYNTYNSTIHWAVIDLGKSQIIDGFKVYHAGAGGEGADWNTKAYKISVSNDNSAWTAVDTVNNNTANVTEDILPSPVTGRYVKFEATTPTNTTDTAARIYELQVYGDDADFPQAVPAAPTVNSISQFNNSAILNFSTDQSTDNCTIKYGTQSGVYDNAITGVNGNSVTIRNLSIGKTYYFTIIPHNVLGDGAPSTETSIRILQNIGVPIDLTKYFNLDGISTVGESPINTAGFDGQGWAYDGVYIPSTIKVPGTTFTLGPTDGANKNVAACSGQTITLPSATTAQSIFVLESATNGPITGSMTINYSDGSSEHQSVTFTDWCVKPSNVNESIVLTMDHRIKNAAATSPTCYIFSQSIPVNSSKQITSITLPDNTKMKIFAMALTSLVDPDALPHDADLSSLSVAGTAITGFDKSITDYKVTLANGTTTSPQVSAVTEDTSANVIITQAGTFPGKATITVTAQDGMTVKTYTVNFAAPSSDTALSGIKIDGVDLAGFDSNSTAFTVTLPIGTTAVPKVTVITHDINAKAVVTDAAALPGTAAILVTAEDGTSTAAYTVNFTVAANELKEVSLSADKTVLPLNDTAQLSVKGIMMNGDAADITDAVVAYSSDNTAVATVEQSSGKITAVGIGSADITAKVTMKGKTLSAAILINVVSTDAALGGIKIGSNDLQGFDPNITEYDVILPAGTSEAPKVTAAAHDANAAAVVTDAKTIPGTATIVVTAQDGKTTKSYTINFTVEELDKVILSMEDTAVERKTNASTILTAKMNDGKDADLTNATIKYFSTNPDIASIDSNTGVISAGNKLGSTQIYVVVTLYGKTVKSDLLTIDVTKKAKQNNGSKSDKDTDI